MNITISCENFFKTWCQVTATREIDLINRWSNVGGQLTSLILYDENAILKEVGSGLGLNYYTGNQGYYYIDGVLFRKQDLFPDCPKDQTWFRKIRVVFEHENNFHSRLNSEVGRLLITNCELRVLVTYPNSRNDWNELDNIHRFIGTTDGSDYISDNESFLLVFGWKNDDIHIEWEGRIFKSNQWKVLKTFSER